MAEYIEREALKAKITEEKDLYPPESEYEIGYNNGLTMAYSLVLAAPTIEAEPVKHGRWLYSSIETPVFRVCDQCAAAFVTGRNQGEYNYCPSCGAKMEVGDD